MHATSYAHMSKLIEDHWLQLVLNDRPRLLRVLDYGSLDVNGTFKPLVVERGWSYVGCDLQAGPNVDLIIKENGQGLDWHAYDLVISGSTLEHCRYPWHTMQVMHRALKPGGALLLLTVHTFPYHAYPVDCYRFFPDGLRALFQYAKFVSYEAHVLNKTDVWGRAYKGG